MLTYWAAVRVACDRAAAGTSAYYVLVDREGHYLVIPEVLINKACRPEENRVVTRAGGK